LAKKLVKTIALQNHLPVGTESQLAIYLFTEQRYEEIQKEIRSGPPGLFETYLTLFPPELLLEVQKNVRLTAARSNNKSDSPYARSFLWWKKVLTAPWIQSWKLNHGVAC